MTTRACRSPHPLRKLNRGLRFIEIPVPSAPGTNQVLVGVEFSPINPNDPMVALGGVDELTRDQR